MNANELVTKEDLTNAVLEMKRYLEEAVSREATVKKWIKSGEVKELLGISDSGLQNLRVNGTLVYSKVSGSYYYDYLAILELLERNKKNQA